MTSSKKHIVLENELIYLGLLEKAREIYTELGEQAVLSYIQSSHRLLSKVYHPDLNPDRKNRAKDIQQRLNRVSQMISQMPDEELIELIRNGARNQDRLKKKILVVEDEVELQDLYSNVLSMEGYEARVAVDGQSGYTAYCYFKPDLVLTDLILPGISGLEMVKKIREKDFRIKVIYMSGFFGMEGLKKDLGEEIRNFGYPTLAKPFKISALLNAIDSCLSESTGTRFHRGI